MIIDRVILAVLRRSHVLEVSRILTQVLFRI